jgi:hypothetical protein
MQERDILVKALGLAIEKQKKEPVWGETKELYLVLPVLQKDIESALKEYIGDDEVERNLWVSNNRDLILLCEELLKDFLKTE